jgi:hypothetical protein
MNFPFSQPFRDKLSSDRYKTLGKKSFPYLLSLLAILIMYFRNTRYFFEPRFWAEEGTVHFVFSYSHNWFLALFQPQVGYLNFWPNISTLLATLPPLKDAPLVTTITAMIVQIIPILIILWSKSSVWTNWYRKLLGISTFLFLPLTNEVWLNTINSFTYFAVIIFLILLEESPENPVRRWLYRTLLILGGLTGTLSCFLIPLFLFKAIDEKKKERLVQTLLLIACAIVQVYLIYTFQDQGNINQRFHIVGFSTLGVTIWTQSLGFFMFGLDKASEWSSLLFKIADTDYQKFIVIGRILLISEIGIFILLTSNLSLKQRILFGSGYGILMILPMIFSIIQYKFLLVLTGLHQRLFFAPNILLGWMLLLGIKFSKDKLLSFSNLVSLLCVAVIGAGVFWGIMNYSKAWSFAEYWPDWKVEVATWQSNPKYYLKIQPEGWVVILPKQQTFK